MADDLTHLDARGAARMVDVGDKEVTRREASARALVRMPAVCLDLLRDGGETKKGNVFQVARLAGIQAAKRTSDLIPLCHLLPLDGVRVDLDLDGTHCRITATVRCTGRTGVEMEALTAASVAALTVYDMLKGLSHDLVIEGVELLTKSGGRSGSITRTPA